MENESLTESESSCAKYSLHPAFSHVYIEKRAKEFALTEKVLSRFKNSSIIEVDNYKAIFNRRNQSWPTQKLSPKLIIALKDEEFLFPATELVTPNSKQRYFYSSQLINCIYDCHYCFLQGMYQSPNFLLFVNSEDFFSHARAELSRAGDYNLAISYDSDILAVEKIFGLCRDWSDFANQNSGIKIEIRTKSANISAIQSLSPKNLILAWTLSPQSVIDQYEAKTPSLNARLEAMAQAAKLGFKIKLCFDPVLALDGWREIYSELIRRCFSSVPPESIEDVTLGTFRMNREHFKGLISIRRGAGYLHSLEKSGSAVGYLPELKVEMEQYLAKSISSNFAGFP